MEQRYLHLVDSKFKASNTMDDDHFMICPKAFYEGLPEQEILAMQQMYKVAFEKARQKTKRHAQGFFDGDGI